MQFGSQTFIPSNPFQAPTLSKWFNVVGIKDVQFYPSMDPQLGDYHHSGGICLTGVWMEEGGGIYVGITTLSLTLKQTQASIEQIVSF